MKKVVKLTEADLINMVKRIIKEESLTMSNKGSLTDIAKKEFSHKRDFPEIFKCTQDPNCVWVIKNARGVKVGGVPNPIGKEFKSKDFIEIVKGDGELSFMPKNKRDEVLYAVDLGSNGIRMNAYWD